MIEMRNLVVKKYDGSLKRIERMTASVGKLAPGHSFLLGFSYFIPRPVPPIENPISKDLFFLQSYVSTIAYFPTCINRIFGNYHQDIFAHKISFPTDHITPSSCSIQCRNSTKCFSVMLWTSFCK